MVYVIIIGAIAVIAFAIYYNKRNNITIESQFKSPVTKIETETTEDSPIGFGYKSVWLAVKCENHDLLAKSIGINDAKPCNWSKGLENAYGNVIFVTPQIDGWVFAVGNGLPQGDTKESIEAVKELLIKLSKEFGEAYFFGTHRVVEFHCWAKATNGLIDRYYAYLGESGENLEIVGPSTEEEKEFNLVNTFSEEAKDDNYWENDSLFYPDEEFVMNIAEQWTINPTKLDEIQEKVGLGIVGKIE